MSADVRNLEPSALWNHFADLNAVPRPSKKEERVIAFAKGFGESLGFPTVVDEVGNVIIKKPATPGLEDRQTVVLQSHLDMVHQKNADTVFDFDTQGIEMFVEEDWVKAKGTTLGADNGIGVATIMALLSSTDIPHPPIEALFTIDEETGMTGAMGLKGGFLDATIMLNLDTEDDDELTIGCAGGIDVTSVGNYVSEAAAEGGNFYALRVKGLTGGHSGADIHLGRGNANKLMNRLLINAAEAHGLRVAEVDGGGLRNAIPRESAAIVWLPSEKTAAFQSWLSEQQKVFKAEYRSTDPDLELVLSENEGGQNVLASDFQASILRSVYACPNGIYRMSPEIEGLVQSSNNLARVLIKDGNYSVQCLTRSSVDTEKYDLARSIQSCFELSGASVTTDGDYPGWEPKPDAPINQVMSNLYQKRFNESAHINAIHAGLECGILGTNYPEMDMISFGPNIRGAHSPDEKVQISSVHKFWGYLLEVLENIPQRA